MIIFCKQCRGVLDRTDQGWRHHSGEPTDGHPAEPLAARRCRLFAPDVIGLPGYDRTLQRLVAREKASGRPTESWRIGLYVFDGRVRGTFRYLTAIDKVPAGSLFQPPAGETHEYLAKHPVVRKRLAS